MSIPLAIGTVAFANLVCHLTIIERPNVNGSWIETMAHPTDDPNPLESNQDGDDPPLAIDAGQPIEPDDANAQTTLRRDGVTGRDFSVYAPNDGRFGRSYTYGSDEKMKDPVPDSAPDKPPRGPAAKQFGVGYLIHDVSRLHRIVMDDIMRPYGITRSQWSMLSALSRSGNSGMTQVDLARLLEIGKVTVGGLLERLETAGQVERRADNSDGRARRVFITEPGYETIRLMIAVSLKSNKRIMKGLTAEEAKIAERALFKIKLNLKDIHEQSLLNGKPDESDSLIKASEEDL